MGQGGPGWPSGPGGPGYAHGPRPSMHTMGLAASAFAGAGMDAQQRRASIHGGGAATGMFPPHHGPSMGPHGPPGPYHDGGYAGRGSHAPPHHGPGPFGREPGMGRHSMADMGRRSSMPGGMPSVNRHDPSVQDYHAHMADVTARANNRMIGADPFEVGIEGNGTRRMSLTGQDSSLLRPPFDMGPGYPFARYYGDPALTRRPDQPYLHGVKPQDLSFPRHLNPTPPWLDPLSLEERPRGPGLIGRTIEVYHAATRAFKQCTVVDWDPMHGMHRVEWKAGAVTWENLERSDDWHLLPDAIPGFGPSTPGMGSASQDKGRQLIGARIELKDKGEWYRGKVNDYRESSDEHFVLWDDGLTDWVHLISCEWRRVGGSAADRLTGASSRGGPGTSSRFGNTAPMSSRGGAGGAGSSRFNSVASRVMAGDEFGAQGGNRTVRVGDRIEIYWSHLGNRWFAASVIKRNASTRQYFVRYDDGDEEWLDLDNPTESKWRHMTAGNGVLLNSVDRDGNYNNANQMDQNGRDPRQMRGKDLVGERIEIWSVNRWRAGRVMNYRVSDKKHQVRFDDGGSEWVFMDNSEWRPITAGSSVRRPTGRSLVGKNIYLSKRRQEVRVLDYRDADNQHQVALKEGPRWLNLDREPWEMDGVDGGQVGGAGGYGYNNNATGGAQRRPPGQTGYARNEAQGYGGRRPPATGRVAQRQVPPQNVKREEESSCSVM